MQLTYENMLVVNIRSGARRLIAAVFILLPCFVSASLAYAQSEQLLRIPMQLDADSTDYDGKTSMLMFRGLRLSQGALGIAADVGRANKIDFEDSVWQFEGNVVIDVDNGHIESDSAEMQFSGYQLRLATIVGTPATFLLKRPGGDDVTYAEAGRLKYDFETGEIEFSDNATITEGGNQIASNYLVYNIREQRINASSAGEGDPKVRITYTPGNANTAPASGDTAENAAQNEAATSAEPALEIQQPDDGEDNGEPKE